MQKPNCIYNKPALSLDEQISLLKSRSLSIDDEDRVKRYLRYIGYFRLSRYFQTFKDNPSVEEFKPNTSFNDILQVYIFDRKLRLLIMDAVERIEVALRSCISNTMSINVNPHWYCDPTNFHENEKFNHAQLIGRIKYETGFLKKSKQNESCRNYYENYNSPELPPSWLVAEVLSIGSWSLIYEHIKQKKLQKIISAEFGLDSRVMISWLNSLTYLRNLCAHHSRVWNRKFTIKPMKAKKFSHVMKDNRFFYAQAVVIKVFLNSISNNPEWHFRMNSLFQEYPIIELYRMGFPNNWNKHQFWQK